MLSALVGACGSCVGLRQASKRGEIQRRNSSASRSSIALDSACTFPSSPSGQEFLAGLRRWINQHLGRRACTEVYFGHLMETSGVCRGPGSYRDDRSGLDAPRQRRNTETEFRAGKAFRASLVPFLIDGRIRYRFFATKVRARLGYTYSLRCLLTTSACRKDASRKQYHSQQMQKTLEPSHRTSSQKAGSLAGLLRPFMEFHVDPRRTSPGYIRPLFPVPKDGNQVRFLTLYGVDDEPTK